jgi:hypothetical protein
MGEMSSTGERRHLWPRLALASLVLGALVAIGSGCRPPAVEFENLHLVASLRTACSAQKTEWLEGVAKAVEARHAAGHMSEIEREHFVELIEIARCGEWEEADQKCLAFEKAQLGRTRERPASNHDHHH